MRQICKLRFNRSCIGLCSTSTHEGEGQHGLWHTYYTALGVSQTVAGINNIVLHEHVCEPTTFSRSPPLPERNDLLHHILVAPNTFPSGQIACPCSPARKYASAFDARDRDFAPRHGLLPQLPDGRALPSGTPSPEGRACRMGGR